MLTDLDGGDGINITEPHVWPLPAFSVSYLSNRKDRCDAALLKHRLLSFLYSYTSTCGKSLYTAKIAYVLQEGLNLMVQV